eukprot:TRINITY_DN55664_c0_g1_i2.p1 TRINITY_DN55664_c0_g1~~TRINITY_DN55664_c0_g1_i2.p1  ORF type:complete len:153 (-),score=17.64 TRINITY_DN55664_c0_g1_i2:311-769(-)
MLRSLVGSEMCIRDRLPALVRNHLGTLAALRKFPGKRRCSVSPRILNSIKGLITAKSTKAHLRSPSSPLTPGGDFPQGDVGATQEDAMDPGDLEKEGTSNESEPTASHSSGEMDGDEQYLIRPCIEGRIVCLGGAVQTSATEVERTIISTTL